MYQTIINTVLMLMVSQLKGGAQATAMALAAGKPITAAKLTLGPNEIAIVTVQIEQS